MAVTKNWQVAQFPGRVFNTTGTWAFVTASNVTTFDHTAAAESTILSIPIAKAPLGELTQNMPASIAVTYTVGTADLSSAPTAVLNKLSFNSTTGVVTRSAVTQTIAFSGADAVGVANGSGAAGTHIATVTVTTPAALTESENYLLELTFPCAATSVLKVTTISETFN